MITPLAIATDGYLHCPLSVSTNGYIVCEETTTGGGSADIYLPTSGKLRKQLLREDEELIMIISAMMRILN